MQKFYSICWLLLALALMLALAGCNLPLDPAAPPPAGNMETAVAPAVAAWDTPPDGTTLTPELASPTLPLPTGEGHKARLTETPAPTPTSTATPLPVLPEGEPYVIGASLGGRALEVYRFGSGEHVRMIVAGIHGGYEWNTVKLAHELIAHIQGHPWVVPQDTTLYILPVINPDGYARQHGADGRANDNNVDLNRNWDHNWQPDWNRSGCWGLAEIGAGAYPHSEPEVQYLADFLLTYPVEALISYHSAALGIFAGGAPTDTVSADLAASLAAVSTYQFPPVQTYCEFTGQFANWASAHGIAAVDLELTNHTDTDFQVNLRVLDAFLKWRDEEIR